MASLSLFCSRSFSASTPFRPSWASLFSSSACSRETFSCFNFSSVNFSSPIALSFPLASCTFPRNASKPAFFSLSSLISSASTSQPFASSSAAVFWETAFSTSGFSSSNSFCFASRSVFIFCLCFASPRTLFSFCISSSIPWIWSFRPASFSSCRPITSARSSIPRMVFPSNFAFFSSFHSLSASGSSLMLTPSRYWLMLRRISSYSFHFPFTASRSLFSISW